MLTEMALGEELLVQSEDPGPDPGPDVAQAGANTRPCVALNLTIKQIVARLNGVFPMDGALLESMTAT